MVVVDDHDPRAKKVAIDHLRSEITFDSILDKITTCQYTRAHRLPPFTNRYYWCTTTDRIPVTLF